MSIIKPKNTLNLKNPNSGHSSVVGLFYRDVGFGGEVVRR